MDLEARRLVVLGLARSGEAAALALLKRGARVVALDNQPAEKLAGRAERVATAGAELFVGLPNTMDKLDGADMLVISPGIPDAHPMRKRAAELHIPVVGEVELASMLRPDLRFLAVTGSNGKTTCTSILAAVLGAAGHCGTAAGNVGTPICSLLDDLKDDAYVAIEMSSYQLRDSSTFHAYVGILLNITPDHLDVHGCLEEYARCKSLIFQHQVEHDFAVYFADDPTVMKIAARVVSRHLPFSLASELAHGGFIRNGHLILRKWGEEVDMGVFDDFLLRGPHNHANLLAAGLAAWAIGIEPRVFIPVMQKFAPLHHRLEPCGELAGVEFINDSKATNVDSVVMALRSQTRPVVLIAGGKDKDGDFSTLIPLIREKVRSIILIGAAAHKMANAWQGIAPLRIIQFHPQEEKPVMGMEEAVGDAWDLARPDGVVLLSPACASFDMYENYEQRGDVFKAEVAKLMAEVNADEG